MSNYVEYKDEIAFHPGYYIQEILEDSGLTQEDFAKRLGTTPKNLSCLINAKQGLSADMAAKLSRMLGTSEGYWLNLQAAYDTLTAKFKSDEELSQEREIFKHIDYKYFVENFHLPELSHKIDEQMAQVRKFLNVASLRVLAQKDCAVNFRSAGETLSEANTVRANLMILLAVNRAMKIKAPPYNKKKFEKAAQYALTLTKKHEEFFPLLREAFLDAGVIFIILPNLTGAKTNGATKKINNQRMLMVSDRRLYSDTFWFTLFHEIGHILQGNLGASFEEETGDEERKADQYASDQLIPPEKYSEFVAERNFSLEAIHAFAEEIDRDPAIVLGRLQHDHYVHYKNKQYSTLRHRYTVQIA